MIRIGIVEDELGDMVDVIRNLMSLDRSRYEFEMVPILLSDPEIDTPEAIADYAEEYGKTRLRQRGIAVDSWPTIKHMGTLCPADEKDRLQILRYLSDQKVNVIISDCWIGRDASSQSKFSDAALKLAGVMLLDSACKDDVWKANNWRCWMMTKYQKEVLEKLYQVGGWRAERFDPYNHYMDKSQIKVTAPGRCDPQLKRVVQEAIAEAKLTENIDLPEEVMREGRLHNIFGRSEPMLKVYKDILAIADLDVTVLLLGESGTGKNIVASAIHESSPRRKGPFVSVNATAIPETLFESEMFGYVARSGISGADPKGKAGYFEMADGGTFFLNEIGDMPLSTQAKVLEVIEGKPVMRLGASKPIQVDVRIITGTNQPLDEMKDDGRFRKDLFFRINVIDIKMPPLRERLDDISLLSEHFIDKFSVRFKRNVKSATPEVLDMLQKHMWPGNVRELSNLIEKAVAKSGGRDVIDLDNDAIVEMAKNLKTRADNDGEGAADIAPSATDDGNSALQNMPPEQLWADIKSGTRTKTLAQWTREIGKPKTLKLIEAVVKDNRGHYPDEAELQKYFNMNKSAWKTWISRNK